MTPALPVAEALADPNLLGAALGDARTWKTWISVVKAAYGRRLDADERALFTAVAGSRSPPARKVRELVAVASRRSGKGRIGAALAVHEALLVDHSEALSRGEVGVVAVISPTLAQSRVMLDYVVGFLEASPIMKAEIDGVSDAEVRLRNGTCIMCLASDYRSLRGRTLLLALLDEASFLRDELSRASDVETARAILPGLMTTGGMLVILSSPYRRAGLVFQRWRDYFGKDDDDCLVVAGPSTVFNPTLDVAEIERAGAADPEAARSEWYGEFRSDLAAFLADADIDAAVDYDRPLELNPTTYNYNAFVDPSGGRHDSFCLAIGHHSERGDPCYVIDVVRGFAPPFNPQEVTRQFAALLKEFGLGSVTGDAYAAEWVQAAFRDAGISYARSERPKSALYLEAQALFARGAISLPDHPVLLRELRLLERRTHRSGKDTVDHGRAGHDDYANAALGAAACAMHGSPENLDWILGPDDAHAGMTPRAIELKEQREYAMRRMHAYVWSGGGQRPWWSY